MACTGDQSLSECLRERKIPYYELRHHKISSWEALIATARHLSLFQVVAYFESVCLDSMESIMVSVDCLEKEAFAMEWKLLVDFIYRYNHFEKHMVSHLNRHLAHLEAPGYVNIENQLVTKCFQGEMTTKQAYDVMETVLLGKLL